MLADELKNMLVTPSLYRDLYLFNIPILELRSSYTLCNTSPSYPGLTPSDAGLQY